MPTRGAEADIARFNAIALGQWLLSQEEANTKQMLGLVRPVFAVGFNDKGVLEPIPNNALCFFTAKKIEVPAGGLISLSA